MKEVIELSQEHGVPTLVDASQSVAHECHDIRELNCDYMVFSGHKMYGPSGIGVVYVRGELLERLDPVFFGGSMVKEVHADRQVWNDIPHRFEPGTPNIEGVIGLATAVEYILKIGYENIAKHEQELIRYAKERLTNIDGVELHGPLPHQPSAPIATF